MVAFVSIVLALSLLGLIVYGLHRYQTMEVEYHVDRTMPLPPIQGDDLQNKGQHEPDKNLRNNPARGRAQRATNGKGDPNKQSDSLPKQQKSSKASWQDQVSEAKRTGDFDLAYALCRDQFPLWSAFNQACVTLRAQLKASITDKAQVESLLSRLFRTAAIAELLHDKSPQAEKFKLHQLRTLDIAVLEDLDFPYEEIGYAHLRLIRKSDVKLMLSCWDRPARHASPREQLAEWWDTQAAALRKNS